MRIKMQVVSQEHQTWPARDGRAAGESYQFMCLDMSQPPQDRMTQPVYYRLSPEERIMYWDKAFDKTFEFILQKLSPTTGGKVNFIGSIVPEPKK